MKVDEFCQYLGQSVGGTVNLKECMSSISVINQKSSGELKEDKNLDLNDSDPFLKKIYFQKVRYKIKDQIVEEIEEQSFDPKNLF